MVYFIDKNGKKVELKGVDTIEDIYPSQSVFDIENFDENIIDVLLLNAVWENGLTVLHEVTEPIGDFTGDACYIYCLGNASFIKPKCAFFSYPEINDMGTQRDGYYENYTCFGNRATDDIILFNGHMIDGEYKEAVSTLYNLVKEYATEMAPSYLTERQRKIIADNYQEVLTEAVTNYLQGVDRQVAEVILDNCTHVLDEEYYEHNLSLCKHALELQEANREFDETLQKFNSTIDEEKLYREYGITSFFDVGEMDNATAYTMCKKVSKEPLVSILYLGMLVASMEKVNSVENSSQDFIMDAIHYASTRERSINIIQDAVNYLTEVACNEQD